MYFPGQLAGNFPLKEYFPVDRTRKDRDLHYQLLYLGRCLEAPLFDVALEIYKVVYLKFGQLSGQDVHLTLDPRLPILTLVADVGNCFVLNLLLILLGNVDAFKMIPLEATVAVEPVIGLVNVPVIAYAVYNRARVFMAIEQPAQFLSPEVFVDSQLVAQKLAFGFDGPQKQVLYLCLVCPFSLQHLRHHLPPLALLRVECLDRAIKMTGIMALA